jgi:hypothetical protein
MKNKLFSLIVFVSLLFSFTGCGLLNKIFHKQGNNEKTEVVIGSSQNMYQVTVEYTQMQVDSMCVADSLPEMFDCWIRRGYLDYETNESIVRYMYIKDLNDNYEMIYIITPRGEMYVVSKRRVVTE